MAAGIGLLCFTIFLLWLLMAAPVGTRTVRRRVSVSAGPARLWSALHPFGADFNWNQAAEEVIGLSDVAGTIVTSHAGRDGLPIRRDFLIEDEVPGAFFRLRYTDDSSLHQSFWADHAMTVAVRPGEGGSAIAEIAETDRYRGFAFLAFRYFALRRQAMKLKRWAETGEYRPGGVFDHPLTQFAMAGVSALLLWPFFGLDTSGLFLALTLTAVVGLHELGHMAAFRMMGHRSARMIFIPILGGIAVGGRPYDRHFEIGFSALMGAGFSAFLVVILLGVESAMGSALTAQAMSGLQVAILICGLFNLGNLMPVWKFDGGQVLRQIFRSTFGQAAAAFAGLLVMAATGVAVGLPWHVLVITGAVLAILSVMTNTSGARPKTALVAMTDPERVALFAAFLAVLSVHALAVVESVSALFYA